MRASTTATRRLPVGAEIQPDGRVHFRVWAPQKQNVSALLFEDADATEPIERIPLDRDAGGFFAGFAKHASATKCYRYHLGHDAFPDPASRFQPAGPHGHSQIVDPSQFEWSDAGWKGVPRDQRVIYEMHIGTFTREGTWAAAARELPELADLGITLLEVMPVAEFPGRFGWGYDGVNLFAPSHLYGSPDDFRAFVNRAHECGIGVLLDVVYNHLGPDGNYLAQFSEHYASDRHQSEWGGSLNFDGIQNGPVREWVIANAGYWIDEYHLDGLRLDATQQIFDLSEEYVVTELAAHARKLAKGREIYVIAENEEQNAGLMRPREHRGCELDALWNDDFHHSAMVALTGRREAYYTDYLGRAQEFVSAAKHGCLYQGQYNIWQRKNRGWPGLDLQPHHYINYIQNHDQVANSLRGQRIHEMTSPAALRAMTALMLLGPNTPLLFQGQEFASSSPFLYFAEHGGQLAKDVASGRAKFLAQFPSIAAAEQLHFAIAEPHGEETFMRSKLNFAEREKHAEVYRLHRDLLALRRDDSLIGKVLRGQFDGAVLSESAFVLRFFGPDAADRLLLVNLGDELHLGPAPEPLLAPPLDQCWHILWSSEDTRYGGDGTPPLSATGIWRITPRTTLLLTPEPFQAPAS